MTAWKRMLLLAALLPLAACQGPPVPADASDPEKLAAIEAMYEGYKKSFPDVPDVTPQEAAALQQEDDALLLDIRTPEEQAVSRIPGAITAETFEADPAAYRDRPIITYCTIGARSGTYARDLRRDGWDARNLRGSILAWTHAHQPLEDPQGNPTQHLHVYGAQWNLAAEGYDAEW